MKTLKFKKTLNIFSILLLADILIFAAYVYLFLRVQDKASEISALTEEVESLTARKENSKLIKSQFLETESLRDKIDSYFISKSGLVKFLNSVQDLGSENQIGIKIDKVSIETAPVSPEIFEMVRLNISISGEWSDLYRFVTLVELLPYRIYIDRVELAKISEKNSAGGAPPKDLPSAPWTGYLDIGVLKLK